MADLKPAVEPPPHPLERLRARLLIDGEPIVPFLASIDWTEPWLMLLIFFHAILLVLSIFTRKNNSIQMGIFIFTVFGIYFAEKLNVLLAHNWAYFARHPYFDHQGIFLSTLWSGPLLCISFVILINSMLTLIALSVKWKKAELKYRASLAACKEE